MRLGALLFGLCVACGASPALRVPPPTSPSTEPWRVMALTPPSLRRAGEAADGSLLLLASSERFRAGHGLAFAADSAPGTRTIEVFPEGTYLWDASGIVFRADGDYLGPLVEAARAPQGIDQGCAAEGVLAGLGADGRLLLFDPTSGIYTPGPPADGPVLDAAWADAGLGLVVVPPGDPYRTRDGGRTFERVDLGPSTVLGVVPRPHAIFALTDRGWRVVTSEGTAMVHELPPDRRRVDDEVARWLDRRLAARAAFSQSVPPGREGTGLRRAGERYERWTPSDGWTAVRAPDGCDVALAGDHPITLCIGAASRPEGRFEWDGRLVHDLAPTRLVASAMDGTSALVMGRRGEREGLFFTDGEVVRLVPLEADEHALDVHDVRVLFTDDEALWALDLTDGARTRVLEGPFDGAHFTTDGAIVATQLEDGRVALSLDGALVARDLPPGARAARFSDRLHGMVIGASLAEVWTTSDGGLSFQPLAIARTGAPSMHALTADRLTCSGAGCRLDPWFFFGPESLVPREGPTSLVVPAPTAWVPPSSPPRIGTTVCEGDAPIAPGFASRTATTLTWGGMDDQGAYEAERALAEGDEVRDWPVVGGTRTLVVLRGPTELAVLGVLGEATRYALPASFVVRSVSGLPDESVVVHAVVAGSPEADLLLHVDAHAARLGRRLYAWPPGRYERAAAMGPSGVGIAARNLGTDAFVYHPIDRGPALALGALPPLEGCGAAPGAYRLVLTEKEVRTSHEIEWTPGGAACPSAVLSVGGPSSWPPRASVLRTRIGRRVLSRGARDPLACVP